MHSEALKQLGGCTMCTVELHPKIEFGWSVTSTLQGGEFSCKRVLQFLATLWCLSLALGID